jgi:ABC-2 type transport system ATP-binding protein
VSALSVERLSHSFGSRPALRGRDLRGGAGLLHGAARAERRARDKARALSGGLRRRVEIARALMHRPQLLLCDEATVGLDAAMRRDILGHVRALGRERGVAVLWATHLIDEVEEADDAIVLHRGEVLWRGAARDMPGHPAAGSIADAFLAMTGAS